MPVSHYFNNYSAVATNEQRVFEDIINESIQIMGHNVQYMPREVFDAEDSIFGESARSKFSRAYTIEMYIANVEGFEGDGDFFSKFGIEIRDNSNFVVARKAFERHIPASIAIRPREGDLIYVPAMNKIFEIKFVEEELLFFSLGKRNPYLYELRCEAFRYSQENIDTGKSEIDNLETQIAYTVEIALGTGSGNYIQGEAVYQGANLASATASAIAREWNPTTKKLQVINVKGAFSDTVNVVGASSGASYDPTVEIDLINDNAYNDQFDNRNMQDEAEEIIITTETDPLGSP